MVLVRVAEAARRLCVSEDTVKRRLHKGELLGYRQTRPQGFTWLIELPDEPEKLDDTGTADTEDTPATTTVSAVEVRRLEESFGVVKMELDLCHQQIKVKDRQIEQLHALLQQSQTLLPALKRERPQWWRRIFRSSPSM